MVLPLTVLTTSKTRNPRESENAGYSVFIQMAGHKMTEIAMKKRIPHCKVGRKTGD